MALAARSPGSRKSLSLSEHNLNLDMDHVTLPVTNRQLKAKKRVVASIGGEGLNGVAFNLGKGKEMSPRRAARRSMQPRKSILKGAMTFAGNDDTMSYTMNHQYAQTIAFSSIPITTGDEISGDTMKRRVSFAPNAHVRMFDPKPLNASTSSTNAPSTPITFDLPQPMTGLQRAQARRSSVPNIPSIFVNEGEAEGELSMDLETESEGSDSDDGGEAGDVQPHCAAHDAQGHDEDAEGEEVDMDVTKFVYGGILRRPSIPANTSITSEVSVVETDGEEEEKTMDFTIAIGGLLPHSPPVGAVSDRASIGYSVPMSPSSSSRRLIPGQLMEGELETEMDETFAIGGIIGADESISSGSGSAEDTMQERTMTFSFGNVRASADEGMEMTVAAGGIIGLSPHSPAPLTRPASGTPSFARPTMSSAQKEKRNVFAPSPSPFKTTPRKSGMDAAGAVAKRLSFGSTTSSGGRKRAREEDGMDGSAKRSRIDSAEGVFGSTSVLAASPIRSATSPRKPLGTPMRMTKSPARSPALRRMLGEEVEGGLSNEQEWEQPPTISLTAFLEMAGVQFMEGLPGLNRRRSSVARGILGQSHSGEREFSLAEYAEAQIQSVFLNMYSWATNKMKDDISFGQAALAATEEVCDLDNPPVIREYLSASDEDKQLFEMTFKAFKTNTQLKARAGWYDWKMSLMGRVRPDVEEMLEGMREDQERVMSISEQAEALLPDLRSRQAALQAELEKERETVAELAACDPQEIADYRAAINEQNSAIASFTKDLSEASTKLSDQNAKLDKLRAVKAEHTTAINLARGRCDRFTRSDVIRLQEEYRSLQDLHMWRPTVVSPTGLQLSYDNEIELSFTCVDFVPDLQSAMLAFVGRSKAKPSATEGLFNIVQNLVAEMIKDRSHKSLSTFVHQVGKLWSVAQSIRSQMKITALRHPLSYSFTGDSLIGTAILLLPSITSKVALDFLITPEIVRSWPKSVGEVEVRARVIYGSADEARLTAAAKETVGSALGEGYLGVWLQSCVDVAGQY